MTFFTTRIVLVLVLCSPALVSAPRHYKVRIKNVYPHDQTAFTQGFIVHNQHFYESTGQNGRSSIRKISMASGRVVQSVALDTIYFAEGLTFANNSFVQLTWKNRIALVYNAELTRTGNHAYPAPIKQGWGLSFDGTHFILSDGTPTIYFLNAQSFRVTRSVVVNLDGRVIKNLNELEYVDGEIFANVWKQDQILRISPESGRVLGIVDASGLLSPDERSRADVLNGIAYDALHKRLFVTGKLWPKVFEIELVENTAKTF